MNRPTFQTMADPVAKTCTFFAKLPLELRLLIMTFAFILQMEVAFGTKDYDEMAKLVCNYGTHAEAVCAWLIALVSE